MFSAIARYEDNIIQIRKSAMDDLLTGHVRLNVQVVLRVSDLHANYDNNQGEIVIYQSENGDTKIDVRFVDETVWLTQQQMAELFQSSRTNIVEHIQHIYEEGELDEESTCRKFRQVRMEGLRQVTREIPHTITWT